MSSIFRFSAAHDSIHSLLQRNRSWAQRISALRPALFPSLANSQSPQILWIGCSDSRVPETSVLDLLPGEVFVHRNIANVLPSNDLSSLSVIQYAVEVLEVKHIIICGHYGCGGVLAAMSNTKLGLIDNWLKHIRDVRARHRHELERIADPACKAKRLVELNVVSQVHNLKRNSNVLDAMKKRGLQVHGFVYDVATGHVNLMDIPKDPDAEVYGVDEILEPSPSK
ncbi:carbonic anhydrase [Kalaharituber pfeilii]|nr:carbonic anhydrase [Kalaharituber pfeilii]